MAEAYTNFELTQAQLLDILNTLKARILDGLHTWGEEIACLPTYIPGDASPQQGEAIVLDFGGTNVRAALVSLDEGRLTMQKGPVKQAIPVTRGVAFKKDEFLDILGNVIAALDPPAGLPLGYCFSYPAASTPDGDATLIRWTKGMRVDDTIGHNVGRMLLDHIAGYTPPIECSAVTVVNDTVASLMAGTVVERADGYIGLIVGTGTNMAAVLDPDEMTKIPADLDWRVPLPVNFESGNFTPPHLTQWDDAVDAASDNPQHQRFEKAVSGVYLASIFNAAMPERAIDPNAGAKGVVDIAYHSDSATEAEKRLAVQILTRSSQLVAASLAAVVVLLNDMHPRNSICIVAEGGLFWGDPKYKDRAAETLHALLKENGLGHIAVKIVSVENANVLGSTVSALSGK